MELKVTKENIRTLIKNNAEGQTKISLSELEKIKKILKDDEAKAVKLGSRCYVVFKAMPSIEFKLNAFKNKEQLNFINKLSFIDANVKEVSYEKFLINEFIQGKGWSRFVRFIKTIFFSILLNLCLYYFSSPGSIQQAFIGILTAVSVFVAIFSLFTISHEYLERKKLSLFEKGKLGYYFSIDKHITTTGVLTIIFAIIGLVASNNNSEKLPAIDLNYIITIILLNLTFMGVFIILRSIVEFYITRPAAFIMGDLKKDSLKEYSNERQKNKE